MKFKLDTKNNTIWLFAGEDYTGLFEWVKTHLTGAWSIKTEGTPKTPYDIFDLNRPRTSGDAPVQIPSLGNTDPLSNIVYCSSEPKTISGGRTNMLAFDMEHSEHLANMYEACTRSYENPHL